MNPPRCKSRRRLNALSVAQMMVAMLDDAMTVYELADLSGLTIQTVRSYLLTLHREGGCHIGHWEPNSRGAFTTPAYRIGRKCDATKPRQNGAERNRRYRARMRQAQMLGVLAGVTA